MLDFPPVAHQEKKHNRTTGHNRMERVYLYDFGGRGVGAVIINTLKSLIDSFNNVYKEQNASYSKPDFECQYFCLLYHEVFQITLRSLKVPKMQVTNSKSAKLKKNSSK